jgi:hypothetical protein
MNMTQPGTAISDRREFLRGAAAVAATAALGLAFDAEAGAASSAAAADRGGIRGSSLAFWNGSRFVSPASLAHGDASFHDTGAVITVRGHFVPDAAAAGGPVLRSLTAHFAVPHEGGALLDAPFHAWASHPLSSPTARFRMPADSGKGLLFSVERRAPSAGEDVYFLGTEPATAGALKLAAGTYVLAVGTPNWAKCRLVTEDGVSSLAVRGGAKPTFEHLLMIVAHA